MSENYPLFAKSFFPKYSKHVETGLLSISRHLDSAHPTVHQSKLDERARARSITFSFFYFRSYRLRSPLLLPFPRSFHLASASLAFCTRCRSILSFSVCRFNYQRCLSADRKSQRALTIGRMLPGPGGSDDPGCGFAYAAYRLPMVFRRRSISRFFASLLHRIDSLPVYSAAHGSVA